jgi:fucose permease
LGTVVKLVAPPPPSGALYAGGVGFADRPAAVHTAGELRSARSAVTAVFFVNGALVASWAPYIPRIKHDLDLSARGLGLVLLAMAVGAVACMPAAGLMVERFGARATLTAVVAVSYVALPFTLLAPDAFALAGVLAVMGAASGITDIAMNANGAAVEQRYGRPILSSLHGLWSIGAFFAAGTTALVTATGLPAELHLVCAALVLGAVGVAACTRLMPSAQRAGGPRPRRARPSRALLGLALISLAVFLAEGAISDWGPLYLRTSLGESATVGAAGYAVFVGSMAVMRLTGDRLTARFGRVPIVRTGALLAGVALASALLVARPAATFVAFACVGFGLANVFPLVVSAAGRSRSPTPAAAIATVSTGGAAGVLIGPPAIGFAADATSLPIALGLVVALCALVVALGGLVGGDRLKAIPHPGGHGR